MHKILFCLLFSLLLSSCTSNTPPKNKDPNTLFIAIGSKPGSLDPRIATDANGMRISSLLFSSLVKVGPHLKIIGDAAENWSYSNLTYSFQLKKGLKFSNGRQLKPKDIEFSFSEYKSKRSPFSSAFKEIKKVTATDTNGLITVKIKLSKFSAKFISSDLPVIKILPKEETIAAGDNFYKNPIGTGSYKYSSSTENKINLIAIDKHSIYTPQIKNLVFKIIRDDFTRYQKMLKGDIDISQSEIPPSKIKEFERRSERFNVHKFPGLSTTYILVNLKNPLLKDKSLRLAIAQGLNLDEIITYKLEGTAQPATSIITPASPFFNTDLQPIKHDTKSASKTVKSLNINKEITLKTSNSQEAVGNAKVLIHQLKKIGLKVKLQSFEWGTFYGDIKKGQFELATMRWVGVSDPDIYRIAFNSKEFPPGRNRGYYTNLQVDELTESGLLISDKKKRIEHYKKVQKIVFDDLAVIPLWYNQQISVVSKHLKNYKPWTSGSFDSFVYVTKDLK